MTDKQAANMAEAFNELIQLRLSHTQTESEAVIKFIFNVPLSSDPSEFI